MPDPYLMRDRFRGFLPVVVDCETGGFNAATDALLEIAAVLLKLEPDGTCSWTSPTGRSYVTRPTDVRRDAA